MDEVLCEALKDVTRESLFCPTADVIPLSKGLHKEQVVASRQ